MMKRRTDDVRINSIKPLVAPESLLDEFPCQNGAEDTVANARRAACEIIHGRDSRLLIIVGPCSIHDPEAAMEYAARLQALRESLRHELEIVMRVYFEKPRTTVGWKGLINDPHLDGSFQINEGLRVARQLLLKINQLGMPTGTEFLDMITPQYHADLIAWGAIGARTTESQVHRELASGLSCPVGFKNGTDGNVRVAVDAVEAASHPHHFLSVTKGGVAAIVETEGNSDGHVILRGGTRPNYDTHSIGETCELLAAKGLAQKVMVDASHANSAKKPERQVQVCAEIGNRIPAGDARVMGLMLESNLIGGRQDLTPGKSLTYGQSVTDGCLGWEETVQALQHLAGCVRQAQRSGSIS
jgi:3-deoxy-7-phosphoheptulonate synthase